MEIEKSELEDEDTNCYQVSDEGEEDYEKNDSINNSDATSQISRGPYERAWTTEATRALIHIRGPMEDEFSEGRAKRTLLWIQVTKILHKMGFRYSTAKVQKKWHNILITYNKNISKKEETGTVAWEFFEDMYLYLKGKRAKTFEYPESSSTKGHSNLDHHTELQQQMQQQHQIIQRQRSQARQRLEQSKHHYRDKTDTNKNSTPRTSQYHNDSSNTNEEAQMVDDEDSNSKRPNEEDTYDQPKSKQQKKQINNFAGYFEEQRVDGLPLDISHIEGANDDSKFDNLEQDPFYDGDWWKDYFNKKLETEKEKITLQKQMHRDVMNYNKMCLMQQEKIERIKIEAINNLTATLQKLVEVKSHKKI